MRPEALDRLSALLDPAGSDAPRPEPVGIADQPLRGDNVQRLGALLDAQDAAQQPGAAKQLLGALGRGFMSVAQMPLAIRAAMGDANAVAPLAFSEQVKRGMWSGSMAQPFADVASTYAAAPWYERLYYNFGNAVDNPGAALVTAAESAPQMVPQSAAMLGGAALGSLVAPGAGTVGGGMAGLGLMSGLQDFTSEYLQAFQEAGVNTADPAALYAATVDPQTRMKAAASAAKHGIAVGLFDGLTAGFSSKLKPLVGAATESMSRVSRAALPRAADMVAQGLGGSAGELTGQVAQGRDTLDTNAIAMEFIAEALQGIGESMGSAARSASGSRRPKITADVAEAWARLNPEKAAELVQQGPTRDAWEAAGLERMSEKERAATHKVLAEILGETPGSPVAADAGLPSVDGAQGPTIPSAAAAPPSQPVNANPLPAMVDPTEDHPATARLYQQDDWTNADLTQAVDALAADKDPSEITANDSRILAESARTESLPTDLRRAAAELLNASPFAGDFPSIDPANIAHPTPTTPSTQETANGQEAQAAQAQVLNPASDAAAAGTTPDVSPPEPAAAAATRIFRYGDGNIAKDSPNGAEHPRTGEPVPAPARPNGPTPTATTNTPPPAAATPRFTVISGNSDGRVTEQFDTRSEAEAWAQARAQRPKNSFVVINDQDQNQTVIRDDFGEAGPPTPVPTFEGTPWTPTSTPPPAAAVSTPTKQKAAKPAGFFTKADLEQRIINLSGASERVLAMEQAAEERAAANNENLDLSDPTQAEDAEYQMGSDNYEQLKAMRAIWKSGVNRLSKAYQSAIEVVKKSMRTSPDPQQRFLAAVHDNLPFGRIPPKVKVNPGDMPVGTTFKINGDSFEIVRGEAADGYTLLKDGEDYPIVPAPALDTIGIDKGTLTKGKGLTANQIAAAESAATPALPPTERDLLGAIVNDPVTGRQSPMHYETDGRTKTTADITREGDDATIANRYDETATGTLSPNDAPDAPKGSDGIDLPFRTAQPGAPLRAQPNIQAAGPIDDSWRGGTPPVPKASAARPKVLSAQWLTKWLSTKFDVPIRYGELGRRASKALGWYRARDQIVRVRGNAWGNLWVAGHEVAHHMDKTRQIVANLSPQALRELATLDYDVSLVSAGTGRPTEGFAEYLARWWLGESADLAAHAPVFTAEFFGSVLPKQAALNDNVHAFADHVAAYFAQSAVARFRSSISPDEKGTTGTVDQQSVIARARAKAKSWYRSFVLNWTDAGYDVTALDWHLKNAGAEADIPLEHIYRNANRAAASSGLDAFMKGVFYMSTGQGVRQTGGFEHVMSLLKDNAKYDDLRDFWLARHALEVIDAGIQQPFRRADLQQIVDELGKDADIVAAADALVEMANGLIAAMVDAKQISYKTSAAVQSTWKHYAPLLKVQEDSFGEDPWKGLRKVGSPTLKRLKGSGAQVIDPIAALAWRYLSTYQTLHRADVTNSLIDALKAAPPELQNRYLEAGFDPATKATTFSLEEIKSTLVQMGMKPSQINDIINNPDIDSTMALFRPDYLARLREPGMVLRYNGNRPELYRLNSDLTAAVQAIAPYDPQKLVSILGGFTRLQRFGAVMTNLGFTLTNPIRDYATYAWQGPGTLAQRLYEPPAEALRLLGRKAAALAGVQIPDETRELFESMHASPHQGAVGYRPDAARIKEVLAGVGRPGIARKLPAAPKWMLKQVVSLNEAIESLPRLAAFRHTLTRDGVTNRTMRQGILPSKKVLLAASQAAAESTVDFSRAGRQRWLGQTLLFANAIIQSNARFLRNFSSEEAFWKAAPAMALQLAATLLYWVDVKDEDWWKNADKNLKYFFWVFADRDGREFLRLPMSYETGAYFSGTALALLDAMENKDASIPWRFVLNTMGRNVAKPAAIMPAVDVYANWDSFRNKPIVPRGQQDDPAYTQFGPQTTRVSRALGSVLNVSPSKIDYLVDGYTGGLFRRLVRPVEKLATGEKFERRDIPFFANITFSQHWDGTQELFTELLRDAQEQSRRAIDEGRSVGIEHERLHELKRYDDMINAVRRENRNVTGRDEREDFEKYLIGLRRRALGFEELKRFPDPIRHPPTNPSVRKAVEQLIGVEAEAASDPMPRRKNGETAVEYTGRIQKWNLRKQQARSFLSDMGWTQPQLRGILIQRHKNQGYATKLTDDSGKPTALGDRMRRLQAAPSK